MLTCSWTFSCCFFAYLPRKQQRINRETANKQQANIIFIISGSHRENIRLKGIAFYAVCAYGQSILNCSYAHTFFFVERLENAFKCAQRQKRVYCGHWYSIWHAAANTVGMSPFHFRYSPRL